MVLEQGRTLAYGIGLLYIVYPYTESSLYIPYLRHTFQVIRNNLGGAWCYRYRTVLGSIQSYCARRCRNAPWQSARNVRNRHCRRKILCIRRCSGIINKKLHLMRAGTCGYGCPRLEDTIPARSHYLKRNSWWQRRRNRRDTVPTRIRKYLYTFPIGIINHCTFFYICRIKSISLN